MKKTYFILSLAAAALIFTQSCRKCNLMEHSTTPVVTNQTVNASIAENTSYTYTLPVTSKEGTVQITSSGAHAKTSSISTDASGNSVYQYTPAANFVGTDVIVITTLGEEEHKSGCFGPGGGNCNHGGNCGHHDKDDQTTITTITLTVTPSTPVVTTTVVNPTVLN